MTLRVKDMTLRAKDMTLHIGHVHGFYVIGIMNYCTKCPGGCCVILIPIRRDLFLYFIR